MTETTMTGPYSSARSALLANTGLEGRNGGWIYKPNGSTIAQGWAAVETKGQALGILRLLEDGWYVRHSKARFYGWA